MTPFWKSRKAAKAAAADAVAAAALRLDADDADVRAVAPPEPVEIVIQPAKGWVPLRLGELWEYRELVYFLTWRDVKVRYKQTVFGASWAIMQPFFTMVVFSIFFGRLGKMSQGLRLPYPLVSYAALVPWTLFATGITQASNSLVASQQLVKKVYFPRLAIPLGTVMAGLVDFVLAFAVLVVMQVFYYTRGQANLPTIHVIWLPLFVVLAFLTAVGVGLWLAALNVEYRDVRYTVPFLVQLWLFATPIIYTSNKVPEGPWQLVWALNPMVGVVNGFRWALLGGPDFPHPGPVTSVSVFACLAILVGGLFYFRRLERRFADLV